MPKQGLCPRRSAAGSAVSFKAHLEIMVKSKNRTALAVAATAGIAVAALLAVLRSDSMRNGKRSVRRPGFELERWDYEGGNIPEVSIASGEQGNASGEQQSAPGLDERGV